jgi:para-aminobenzoate synthetase component 1
MVMPSASGLFEIHEPGDAFERLEAHLRASGFLGASETAEPGETGETGEPARRAQVYLGYGLSETLRRGGSAARPETGTLPLAACRVEDSHGSESTERESSAGGCRVGRWEATWTAGQHVAAIRQAREAIAAGEIYQVNLVQHLSAGFEGDISPVAAALAPLGPLHGRPMLGPGWAIVSASPELFLARRGARVWTMPIKGTRPRGEGRALLTSAKDAAEHVMIVDLERNDLGRVCEPGSIRWPELMRHRSMAGVEHLVSLVEGRLRQGVTFAEILRAMFPGGSVTGAPKVAAVEHIRALEPVGRGASMGALGNVWPNGDFDLALTIRTFAITEGRIHLWVGGGVVWDSDPTAEVEESWVKARPLLRAIETGTRARMAA